MTRTIHTIFLPRGTDPERIVETFERINRTGKRLTIFELVTAKLYKDKIKLRDLLETARKKYEFLKFVDPESVLKVIALLRGKEPNRKNIFETKPTKFEEDWERACKALESAYARITDIKNGYGVLVFRKWMPYSTMIVPLASMIDYLKTEKLETEGNYDKIDRWYWISVFSNAYDQAVDTKSYSHFGTIKDWIRDGKVTTDFVQKFDPEAVDLDIDKQSSAIYRGVISMIVLKGALYFKTGQAPQFGREKIQDDHIFPKSIYKDDRIVNRTLISTNAEKGNKKPSEYFKQRLEEHGEERLKNILESHIIPDDALDALLSDDMKNFITIRKQALINALKERAGC